jgi:G:T/U-mismatch repair DNA glycosylase
MVFDKFRETGSAYGAVHAFVKEGIQCPKRAYGGAWNGRLIWGRLSESRVEGILKNPAYAGAYVHGRYKSVKDISADGTFFTRIRQTPMESWTVLIKDHHEGYISWEAFLENKETLERNRTNGQILPGPAREGHALLQGLLLCGICGRRITVRYTGNGGIYPIYECNWQRREGLSTTSCLSIRCDLLDGPIIARLLEAVEPKQIEIAIEAFEEFERRQNVVDNQWRMKLERAQYEVDLAQRRYENVDPANRLVAATLERRWNEALARADEVRSELNAHQGTKRATMTVEQNKDLLSLAKDLPSLWESATTQDKDRKRILRLLIKDIAVDKLPGKQAVLHLRWQGGAHEDILVTLPPSYCDQIRYPKQLVDRVRVLAQNLPDGEVASTLNKEGLSSAKGSRFTRSIVAWIRYTHQIPTPVCGYRENLPSTRSPKSLA